MSHNYGQAVTDFQTGQRVALHPALDAWMRGQRYGTVSRIGRKWVWISLDNGDYAGIHPNNLRLVNP